MSARISLSASMARAIQFAHLVSIGKGKVKHLRPVGSGARPSTLIPDDSPGELRGTSVEAGSRLRERARCSAIIQAPAASRNSALARSLTFDTRMGRTEAIALLEAMPASVD